MSNDYTKDNQYVYLKEQEEMRLAQRIKDLREIVGFINNKIRELTRNK